MNYEFHSASELLGVIRDINQEYYQPARCNIALLEKTNNYSCVAYNIALRDAHHHLTLALSYADNLAGTNKTRIHDELVLYADHLRNLLADTYNKLVDGKLKELNSIAAKEDVPALRAQFAMWTMKLRCPDKNTVPENMVEKYQRILNYIDKTIAKYKSA
jgi:hypothetical protein